MMEPAPHDLQTLQKFLARLLQDADVHDASAPMRAGMRARAIADACETLGLAAVLIDGTGRVLHVGASAAAVLGGDLDIAAGHLVGASQHINHAVQRAVTTVINGEMADATPDPEDDDAIAIAGLPYRDPSPFQRLSGVLVIVTGGAAKPRLAALRSMLTA